MVTLRQIRSVVAVVEEQSFTRAAKRENATQSGVSQHVAAVEQHLGTPLFERGSEGVIATAAGRRYYAHCIDILRSIETAEDEARAAGGGMTGKIRAGLIPAFTRGALAPALDRFTQEQPGVEIEIIEGYSGALTDMVRAQDLDFALVPGFAGGTGLRISRLARSREMLVSGPSMGLRNLVPLRLADLPPVKLIVPSAANIRRVRIEEYVQSLGVRVERLLEMDAMIGTLELVAASDWVTILPWVICGRDAEAGGQERRVSPLIDPSLHSDFVVIEPASRPLSPEGSAFLDAMRSGIEGLGEPG